jgi:hypothetical protein
VTEARGVNLRMASRMLAIGLVLLVVMFAMILLVAI